MASNCRARLVRVVGRRRNGRTAEARTMTEMRIGEIPIDRHDLANQRCESSLQIQETASPPNQTWPQRLTVSRAGNRAPTNIMKKLSRLTRLPTIVAALIALAATSSICCGQDKNLEAPKDVAEAPNGAEKTKSGLASKVLKKGAGDKKPKATDTVTVHYSGWTTDGKLFDSSVKRGKKASFPLNRVIKGWTEGLQLMVVGEKRRFWIPAELAYGKNPGGGRPGGMLVFDVELFKIGE